MDLRHASYFVAVVEEGSFTRAAKRLSVAQSPVSHQIRRLERILGVQLLLRTTRSVRLTEAGRVFYHRCLALLDLAEDAQQSAKLAARGQLGELSLGFVGTATYDVMPNLIRGHRKRNPEVVLKVKTEMLTPLQVSALVEGTLSAGLLRPPVNNSRLVVEFLRDDPLVAVLPVHHPFATYRTIDLADLAEEEFISYSRSSTTHDKLISACESAGFKPKIRQEVAETASLVALVAAGTGVALAAEPVQHLRLNGVSYRPLRFPKVSIPLAVAYREDNLTPQIQRYLDTVRSVLGGRSDTGASLHPDNIEGYIDTI